MSSPLQTTDKTMEMNRAEGTRKDDIHAEGIEKLSAPGVDSNWLEWSFLMETCISASIYAYVMKSPSPIPPPPHYEYDKAKICALLARYVSKPNLRVIQRYRGDPKGMWSALRQTHESNTAGTRMMWLEKLVGFKMEEEDLMSELDRLETISERLTSLITPTRPLSVDEILTMVVSISLPDSYKPTLTPLLQRDSVTSAQVLAAVREDFTRRNISAASMKSSEVEVVSVATERDERRDKSERKHCSYCRKPGHDLESCWSRPKKGKSKESSTSSKYDELKSEFDKLKSQLKRSHKKEKANVTKDSARQSKEVISSDDDSEFSYHAALATAGAKPCEAEVVDSGCSIHMRPSTRLMSKVKDDVTKVHLADGSAIKSTARGEFNPGFKDSSRHNAIVIPKLKEPLLSVSKLADTGIVSIFDDKRCLFYRNPTIKGEVIGETPRRGGLYYMSDVRDDPTLSESCNKADDELLVWHRRFNHTNIQTLRRKLRLEGVNVAGSSDSEVRDCRVCVQGKMRRGNMQSRQGHKAEKKFRVIHTDVSKYGSVGRDGSRYFVFFLDDYSKFVRSYAIKQKSNVLECFKKFKNEVESLDGVVISELRSDNGGEYGAEYQSSEFSTFCNQHGITQTVGPPYTPELNGVAERWNRTIKEKIRCSLLDASLPNSFWPYALSYCTETDNHLPTRTNSKFTSPISLTGFSERKPEDFHSFGCEVWYHVRNTNSKLIPRARQGIFVAYLKNNLGVYVYDVNKRNLVKATSTRFFESSFPGKKNPQVHDEQIAISLPWPSIDTDSPVVPDATSLPLSAPVNNEPSRPKRVTRPPDRYGEYGRYANLVSEPDPKSYKQAKKSLNWEKWREATVKEFESLIGKETWRLVPRPARRRIIRCKWVFKTKLNVDKSLDKLKARLVALGFSQIKGVDFHEVFSPTSRQESLRLLVSVMAHKGWK